MNRFKVKNLTIGLLDDEDCADDPNYEETEFPCRKNALPKTEIACAKNSDTSLGCVQGIPDETLRPCFRASTQNRGNKCVQEGIPEEHKTKFYCMDQDKPGGTKIPCKGGSNTEIPGMPDNPWQGCLKGSKTKKACSPVPPRFETKYQCQTGSDTKQACKQRSDTKKPCAYRHGPPLTRFECMEGTNTKHACNQEEKRTEFPCQEGRDPQGRITKSFCKTETTKKGDKDCGSRTIYCKVFTLWGTTPFADAGSSGELQCPPLSALALGDQEPGALHALKELKEDLRTALGVVERRSADLKESLEPKNLEEAVALESKLSEALDESRRIREAFEAREKSPSKKKAAPSKARRKGARGK